MHFLYIFSQFFAFLAFCYCEQNVSSKMGANDGFQLQEEIKLDAEWSCGTDTFSKFLAEATVEKDCPEKKNTINNCCVAHDKCYDDQKGLKQCDDIFCNCLVEASAGNEVCAKEDAPYFCQLVQQFGEQFYNASANTTSNQKPLPIVPTSLASTVNDGANKNGPQRLHRLK